MNIRTQRQQPQSLTSSTALISSPNISQQHRGDEAASTRHPHLTSTRRRQSSGSSMLSKSDVDSEFSRLGGRLETVHSMRTLEATLLMILHSVQEAVDEQRKVGVFQRVTASTLHQCPVARRTAPLCT
jgi:hypothetical protein